MNSSRRHFLKSSAGLAAALALRPTLLSASAAEPARPPNILFLFPDQWRADWLGCAGLPGLRTPHLDALAARGLRVTRAYTPCPLCAPARACLATGRAYADCGVPDNKTQLPHGAPGLYHALRAAGYATATVGKLDLDKPSQDWGLDGRAHLASRGFDLGSDCEGKIDASSSYRKNRGPRGPYMKHLADRGLADLYVSEHRKHGDWKRAAYVSGIPDPDYCDRWITDRASDALRELAPDRPWFLQVNFSGPHSPFDVTAAMAATVADRELPPPVEPSAADRTDHVRARRHYAAMIEAIDAHIGRLLEQLAARPDAADTLVLFSSDHGEMLGDHGRWAKETWHEAAVAIPLLAAGPGVAPGRVSSALVGLEDIAATALDYAGAKPLPAATARTLRPLFAGATDTHRESYISALGDWRMHLTPDSRRLETAAKPT